MFLVRSVYFNLRNILPKSGTFLPGHPVYTSTLHHYVTIYYIYNTVQVNVLLWLYLYGWKNWEMKTNNKEIPQIFENKLEYNEAVYQLFIDFKEACDSVRGKFCIIF